MSQLGQSLPKWAVRAMSGLPLTATDLRTSLHVRFVRWSQPVDATLYLKGEMECA